MTLKDGLTLVVTLAALSLGACGLLRNPNTEREAAAAAKAAADAARRAEATKPVRNPALENRAQQGAAAGSRKFDEGRLGELPESTRELLKKGGEEGVRRLDDGRRDDASGNSALSGR